MKTWIIYSAYRRRNLVTKDVRLCVQMVRGRRGQHPNEALKKGGRVRVYRSTDSDISLEEFKLECRRKAR